MISQDTEDFSNLLSAIHKLCKDHVEQKGIVVEKDKGKTFANVQIEYLYDIIAATHYVSIYWTCLARANALRAGLNIEDELLNLRLKVLLQAAEKARQDSEDNTKSTDTQPVTPKPA